MRSMLFSVAMVAMVAGVVADAPRASAAGSAVAACGRAAAAEKFAVLFFWKEKNAQTDRAWAELQKAAVHATDWAEVIAVQVTDPGEQELVARYDVSRAPMPLVLAVAPCGAVTKAFTGGVTEGELRTARVSPCAQLCLKAIQDRKLVLLCVVNAQDSRGAVVPQGVRDFKADGRFGPATEVILVNARDEREAGFLKELQVDARVAKPVTVLLAPPGSVVGTFEARATKEQFVARLASAQANPCADGACGPNGCGPQK